jgi:Ca2+-binding EF-hand superfamily protein
MVKRGLGYPAPMFPPRSPLLGASLCLLLMSLAPPVQADFASTPQQQLQRMDSDGNGRIDAGEYRAWLSRGFRAMDRNGDGQLQAEELPPGTRFRQGQALSLSQHQARLDARFALQDRNGDGFLDAQELAAPPAAK